MELSEPFGRGLIEGGDTAVELETAGRVVLVGFVAEQTERSDGDEKEA